MNTSMTGAAGEHYVMFKLLRHGFIAGLAPQNAKDIDILVSDESGAALSTVQVKMAGEKVTVGWQMRSKHEAISRERLFYCFVCPGAHRDAHPTCWIVPSAIVAQHVATTHQAWLAGTPKRGDTRADGDGRKMHLVCNNPPMEAYPAGWMDQYREAWHLLR